MSKKTSKNEGKHAGIRSAYGYPNSVIMHRPAQAFVDLIADQILNYLRRHREAKDTFEGITEWWLLEQRIRTTSAAVKEALSDLLARGLIVQHQAGGGKLYYSLKKKE